MGKFLMATGGMKSRGKRGNARSHHSRTPADWFEEVGLQRICTVSGNALEGGGGDRACMRTAAAFGLTPAASHR